MRIYLKKVLYTCTAAMFVFQAYSQQKSEGFVIGKAADFADNINGKVHSNARQVNFSFRLSEKVTVSGIIDSRKTDQEGSEIVGTDSNHAATFSLNTSKGGRVTGRYHSIKNKVYYSIDTDAAGNVVSVEEDMSKKVCVDYHVYQDNSNLRTAPRPRRTTAIPKYESLPGAKSVIYIDLDGEMSVSRWGTINAASFDYTDAEVKIIWDIAAQDYIAFNVNVTTDLAVFQAAAKNARKRCIVTPTTTAAPGAGGVAYINTFDDGSDDPCWVFNESPKVAGETVSHEVGHTVGLNHDGQTGGSSAYYQGHNNWGPIMGSAYGGTQIGQWSIGEYSQANNTEDDLKIIVTQNGFTYRADDAGNTIATARQLTVAADGGVAAGTLLNGINAGVITNRTDIDVFKLTAPIGGKVNLTIKPAAQYPDLNIKARLLDATGTEVFSSNPAGTSAATMAAAITGTLTAGTYYLEIDGVGDGASAAVGYSDYSCIGDYYISGTAPSPDPKPVAGFSADITSGCTGIAVTFKDLSSNSPSSWLWTLPGSGSVTSAVQNPTVIYNTKGTYKVTLKVSNSYGDHTATKEAYITIDGAEIPVANDVSICSPGGTVTLHATQGSGSVIWFSDSSYASKISSGVSYAVNVTATKKFYVAGGTIPAPAKLGPVANTIGTGADHAGGQYLIFNALKTFVLKTVKVYATGAKNRTFQLKDSAGTVLMEKTVMVSDGESRVTLNMDIPHGRNYQIGVAAGANLYRNDGGVTYPYTVANLAEIIKSTAAGLELQYYYYLYDWEIQDKAGCYSKLIPVKAVVETCTSLEDVFAGGFNVYPNPSEGSFVVNTISTDGELIITDMQGKEIRRMQVDAVQTQVSGLNKGCYILRYQHHQSTAQAKLIVQ